MNGRTRGAIDEQIAVTATVRGKARMEFIRHRMRPQHRDAFRQQGIHATHPCAQRTIGLSVKMHHLLERVYACVCAARRDHRNLLPGDLTQRVLQRVLDSPPFRLALPSAKRMTVILDTQCDSHRSAHHNNSSEKLSSNASLMAKRYNVNSICLLIPSCGSNKLRKLSCQVCDSRNIATSA